jgi:hypothetical protein
MTADTKNAALVIRKPGQFGEPLRESTMATNPNMMNIPQQNITETSHQYLGQ